RSGSARKPTWINSPARQGYRLTGELKSEIPADPPLSFTHRATPASAVESWRRLASPFWRERSPRRPRVPRGTPPVTGLGHGRRAAAGRYHGARPRISPKAFACELGGNRLPQVQVNAPARRRVPASLRLRTSLRDPAAVRGTKRDADTVRHAVPGSLEAES